MGKIIYSKTRLDFYETFNEIEFNDCISDLMKLKEVQKLDEFSQHLETSRLQHSLNVSYHSYIMCKFFHFDWRSAARAGLLHDLFLYDWREEKQEEGSHAFAHPKIALKTAKKITTLNKIEEDAIAKHMWPLCASAPKYAESFIVSLADKYCCIGEVFSSLVNSKRRKAATAAN